MGAIYVITDHQELRTVGTLTHDELEAQLGAKVAEIVSGPNVTVIRNGDLVTISATGAQFQLYKHTCTAGVRDIILPWSYKTGTNSLWVLLEGAVRQTLATVPVDDPAPDGAYWETDEVSIRLCQDPIGGERIHFLNVYVPEVSPAGVKPAILAEYRTLDKTSTDPLVMQRRLDLLEQVLGLA